MTRSAKAALIACLLAWSAPLHAEIYCPVPAGASPSLAGFTADERLTAIHDGLDRGARRARIWAWTWGGIYATTTIVQLATIPIRGGDSRKDVAVAAPGAFLGVAVLALAPLKVMGDQRRLGALLADAGPSADRCALLTEAERMLARDAASEAFGASPLVHLGNVVVNLGLALALGLGFGHWTAAGISLAVGVAVGELQILTQPSDVVDLDRRYRGGELPHPRAVPGRSWSLAPVLGDGRYGLHFGVRF